MLVFAVTASILSGSSQLFAGGLCTKPSVAHAPQTIHNTTNYNFAEGSTGVVNPTGPVTVHQHGSRSSSHSSRSREGQAARGRTTARQTAGSHRDRPVTPRDGVTSRRASAESGRRSRGASRATAGHKSDSDDGDDIPEVATFDLEATAEEKRVAFRSPVSIISPTHQRTPDSADFPSPETATARTKRSSSVVKRIKPGELVQSPVARAPRKSAPHKALSIHTRRSVSPRLHIANLEAIPSPSDVAAEGTGGTTDLMFVQVPGVPSSVKYGVHEHAYRDEQWQLVKQNLARSQKTSHAIFLTPTTNLKRKLQELIAAVQSEQAKYSDDTLQIQQLKFEEKLLSKALAALRQTGSDARIIKINLLSAFTLQQQQLQLDLRNNMVEPGSTAYFVTYF